MPGFVDSHSHLVFAGDRAAEFAARMAGEPYAAGGIRTTVAATRAATDEQLTSHVARLVAEMRAPGHDHRRDQERLRPQRPRRGAQPGGRAAVHRGDHVPRRPRGAARAPTPEEYVDAGHRPDARGGRAVRALDRRVLRDAAPSTPTRRARSSPPARPPGCAAGCTPTSSARAPASGWPAELGPGGGRPLHLPRRRRRRRAARLGHDRDAAARAWSSRPGSPTPTPGGCSTPACGSRWPATATRAPASPARCRSASRWRSARWG